MARTHHGQCLSHRRTNVPLLFRQNIYIYKEKRMIAVFEVTERWKVRCMQLDMLMYIFVCMYGYLPWSSHWGGMWYMVGFNVCNPSAYTWVKNKNCPTLATNRLSWHRYEYRSYLFSIMGKVSLEQLFPGTGHLTVFIFASCASVREQGHNWVPLCPKIETLVRVDKPYPACAR